MVFSINSVININNLEKDLTQAASNGSNELNKVATVVDGGITASGCTNYAVSNAIDQDPACGDKIRYVIDYDNTSNDSQSINITDNLSNQTLVSGSLNSGLLNIDSQNSSGFNLSDQSVGSPATSDTKILTNPGTVANTTGTTGGDGYLPILFEQPNRTIACGIYHHMPAFVNSILSDPNYESLNCINLATGASIFNNTDRIILSSVSGSSVIFGQGSLADIAIADQAHIVQSSNGRYVYYSAIKFNITNHNSDVSGVGCLDLRELKNCGFKQFGGAKIISNTISATISALIKLNNKMYYSFGLGDVSRVGSLNLVCIENATQNILDSGNVAALSPCNGTASKIINNQSGSISTLIGQYIAGTTAGGIDTVVVVDGSNMYCNKITASNVFSDCFNSPQNYIGSFTGSYHISLHPTDSNKFCFAKKATNLTDEQLQCWDSSNSSSAQTPTTVFTNTPIGIDSFKRSALVTNDALDITYHSYQGRKYYAHLGGSTGDTSFGFIYCDLNGSPCPGFGINGYLDWPDDPATTNINESITKDYGYTFYNSCGYGLGDSGVLWSFDPLSGDSPCKTSQASLSLQTVANNMFCGESSIPAITGAQIKLLDTIPSGVYLNNQVTVKVTDNLTQTSNTYSLTNSQPIINLSGINLSNPNVSAIASATLNNGQTWQDIPVSLALITNKNPQICFETRVNDDCSVTSVNNTANLIANNLAPLSVTSNTIQVAPSSLCVKDVGILKTFNQEKTYPGATGVPFTLKITNYNGSIPAGTVVNDVLNSNFTNIQFLRCDNDNDVANTLPSNVVTACNTAGNPSPVTGQSFNYTLGALPNSTANNFVIYLYLRADISPVASGTISNTSTVTTPNGVTEANNSNNNSTDNLNVQVPTNLVITKVLDDITATGAGSLVGYTIKVENKSTVAVSGVKITDNIPDTPTTPTGPNSYLINPIWNCGVESAGTGTPGNTFCGTPNNGTGDIVISGNSLNPGAILTIHITATTADSKSGDINNIAQVEWTDPITGLPESDSDNASIHTLLESNFVIEKKVITNPVVAGAPIEYEITVTNNGPSQNFINLFTDYVPAEISDVTWTCTSVTGCYDALGQTKNSGSGNDIYLRFDGRIASDWTAAPNGIHSFPVGATATIHVMGTLESDFDTSKQITNEATFRWVDPSNPYSGIKSIEDSVTSSVVKQADLEINKSVEMDMDSNGNPARTGKYILDITNNGPSDVLGATVIDNLPSQITNVNWNCSSNCSPGFGTGNINTVVNLPMSQPNIKIEITFTLNGGVYSEFSNTATITPPTDVTDSNPNNNTDTEPLTPFIPDSAIGIAKTASQSKDNGDGSFTTKISLKVKNYGDLRLSNLSVTDDLEAVLIDADFSVSNLTATGGILVNPSFNGKDDIELVDDGTSGGILLGGGQYLEIGAETIISFDLKIKPNPGHEKDHWLNVAVATAKDEIGRDVTDNSQDGDNPDPDQDGDPKNNNTPTNITNPQALVADISVSKKVASEQPIEAGKTIKYEIVVENKGPAQANGITVIDNMPSGVSNAQWTCLITAGIGDCGLLTGSGNINTNTLKLNVNAKATYSVIANINNDANANSLINFVEVIAPGDVYDPDKSNNTAKTDPVILKTIPTTGGGPIVQTGKNSLPLIPPILGLLAILSIVPIKLKS